MRDVDRGAGLPPDVQRFLEGRQRLVVLVAQVGGIREAGALEGGGHGGQFVQVGERARQVLEAAGDPAGASPHGFGY